MEIEHACATNSQYFNVILFVSHEHNTACCSLCRLLVPTGSALCRLSECFTCSFPLLSVPTLPYGRLDSLFFRFAMFQLRRLVDASVCSIQYSAMFQYRVICTCFVRVSFSPYIPFWCQSSHPWPYQLVAIAPVSFDEVSLCISIWFVPVHSVLLDPCRSLHAGVGG